jgi:uncharacterized protein (DUF924 family)
MKAYPKMICLVGACVIPCIPLLVQAQGPMNNSPQTRSTHLQESENINTSTPMRGENSIPEGALDILNFWFGDLSGPGFFPEDKMSVWFARSPEVDHQIHEDFSEDMINAMRGDYNSWRETPRGRLALILLLDQFPRHIYRNKPQEFMSDRMARALALEGIQKGDDKYLYPIERAFFYLPFEHSEDLGMQNVSVASYQKLLADSPREIKPHMQDILHYAILHQQQIARFGRFPHRNVILGRESKPEEVVFLRQWGRPNF